jgi:hypothetical protein
MKTRMLFKLLLLIASLSVTSPVVTYAAETPRTVNETPDQQAARLSKRLEEIKAIDVKELSKRERKTLRAEVRSIKKEMKKLASGGVYISIGALLLIILLIILLA